MIDRQQKNKVVSGLQWFQNQTFITDFPESQEGKSQTLRWTSPKKCILSCIGLTEDFQS